MIDPGQRHIFLTGATGTIGGHLVLEYLADDGNRLTVLARDKGRTTAETRVARSLRLDGPDALPHSRLRILRGDVSLPRLGLAADVFEDLAESTNLIVHSAATTRLSDSDENCARVNLQGTLEVLQLAAAARAAGRLERLCHVSTAYVAGNRLRHALLEDSLPANPEFSNAYERSKHAAEGRVREAMRLGLPVTILRPSIVVGDSTTGRPGSFNVLYPLCRLLANGMLSKIPIQGDSCINIVPIDFVVRAIAAISTAPESIGKTYHLVTKQPPPMSLLMDLQDHYPDAAHIFQRTEFVDPKDFDPTRLPEGEQQVFAGLAHYLPYLEHHLEFDTRNMDALLPKLGLCWPETGLPLLRRLFEYVVQVGYISTR